MLILAAGLAAYANSFSGPFVLDDLASILHNETLRHLWPPGPLLAPPPGTTVSGRPLLNVSLALNYAWGGANPWGYHAVNLGIHLLAGLTLFGIIRRLVERAREGTAGTGNARGREGEAVGIAFVAALLWTVHPLQTQAVTYVVQRAESLMGLFYFLTVYFFIGFADCGTARRRPPDASCDRAIAAQESRARQKLAAGSPTRRLWAVLSVLACLSGMATKEVMATAPVMVFLLDRTFYSGSFREAWRARRSYYLALGATWILLGILVASTGGTRSGTSGFGVGVSAWAYWLTQFEAVVRYLCLSVWPHPLVFEYGTFWTKPAEAAPYAVATIAVIAGSWHGFFARSEGPGGGAPPGASPARMLGFCGAWFFGVLSVTSLVPGIYQMIVEHRVYLPLAAVTGLAALGLWRALGAAALPVALGLATLLGWMTHERNKDYRSAVALWQDTVDKRPENETAQTSLAIALFDAGRASEAVGHYEAALRLKPDSTDTLNDFGCALLSLGRVEEGIVRLREAVRLDPGVAQYRLNLGNGLAGANRLEEAIGQFRTALKIDPGYAQAHLKLALALWLTGKKDEALAERAEGLRLQGH